MKRRIFCILLAASAASTGIAADSSTARTQFLVAHKLAKAGLDWQKAAPDMASYPLRP